MTGAAARPALFLDRDGTLIQDVGYISDPHEIVLLDGVADGLQAAQSAGYALVIVSNQSGIGRGLFDSSCNDEVDAELRELLAQLGVELDASYYCPHRPDAGCPCRKPQPGLLLAAARELDIQLSASWMVGDRASDVEAGLNAGCRAASLGFSYASSVPEVESVDHLVRRFL
jgi:histidinol-phosphate phosphatase family protein